MPHAVSLAPGGAFSNGRGAPCGDRWGDPVCVSVMMEVPRYTFTGAGCLRSHTVTEYCALIADNALPGQ